jgi:uncharacterized protein YdeI (YjbR/CyaY-like superfamily)
MAGEVKTFPTLKRPTYPMPGYVKKALQDKKLMVAYVERPPYQQNDYVFWITRAKREETKQKRLDQMIRELKNGKLYMNMKWR